MAIDLSVFLVSSQPAIPLLGYEIIIPELFKPGDAIHEGCYQLSAIKRAAVVQTRL